MKLKNQSRLIARALLVCSRRGLILAVRFFLLASYRYAHTHTRITVTHNYTNLMPHSPLLISNSVHIFIPALNEGAATRFAPNKREVRFILHLGATLVGGGGERRKARCGEGVHAWA